MFDTLWGDFIIWLVATAHVEVEHFDFLDSTVRHGNITVNINLWSVVTFLDVVANFEFARCSDEGAEVPFGCENIFAVFAYKVNVVSLLGVVFVIEIKAGVFFVF